MSGYFLYQSSDIEFFISGFPEVFFPSDPLNEYTCIVVQNAGLGEWLSRSLSEKYGAFMGPDILLPETALREIVKGYDSVKKEDPLILFQDDLKLAVYKALEEFTENKHPAFDHINNYLNGTESFDFNNSLRNERLWPLSNAVAGMFYFYGMNNPELVKRFEHQEGRIKENTGEYWQSLLWNRIFGESYRNLGSVLRRIVEEKETYKGKVSKIILFGSMFLGRSALEFFRHLSGKIDVHHFLFTPSEKFAEPTPADFVPESSLLNSSAKPSGDFSYLLNFLNIENIRYFPGGRVSHEGSEGTLLNRLQYSLEKDIPFYGNTDPDGSLVIHNTAGEKREVEVLKDRILLALIQDKTLKPTEIEVLAPDINKYAPYIEAVFKSEGSGNLPFNINDLSSVKDSPYLNAFETLLEIPGSRFGKSLLAKLFSNPCFNSGSGDWAEYLELLNIRWGADRKHRKSFEVSDDFTGSWDAASQMLFSGYIWDDEDALHIKPYIFSGDSEADNTGDLLHTVRMLKSGLLTLNKKNLTLPEWIDLWKDISEKYLKVCSGDDADKQSLAVVFRNLKSSYDNTDKLTGFNKKEIPWSVFKSLLLDMLDSSVSRHGRYLANGITCASLKPSRSIPFRRIYVLGLSEGAWPGRELLQDFDLRENAEYKDFIDLSRESIDRFAFIETIFSAKEHLSLFYNGRDQSSGEDKPPSSLITGLLEYIGNNAAENLVIRHPFLPFSPVSLNPDNPETSTFSKEALKMGRIYYRIDNPESFSAPEYLSSLSDTENKEIPFVENNALNWRYLYSFLRNPTAWYFRRILGIPGSERETETGDLDIFEPEKFSWTEWCSNNLNNSPDKFLKPDNFTADFKQELVRERSVSLTPFLDIKLEELKDETVRIAEIINSPEIRNLIKIPVQNISFSPAGKILENTQNKNMYFLPPVFGNTQMENIYAGGTFEGIRIDNNIWNMLEYSSAAGLGVKNYIKSWLFALLAGSLPEENRPERVSVYFIGSRIAGNNLTSVRHYVFDPADADGGDSVYIDSEENLKQLGEFFYFGNTKPVPLYPSLAEEFAKKIDAAVPDIHSAAEEARKIWNKIVYSTDGYGFYDIRNCAYRKFLGEPDFSDKVFFNALLMYIRGGLV